MPEDNTPNEEPIRVQVYKKYRTRQLSFNPDVDSDNNQETTSDGADNFDIERIKYHLSWRHRESAILFASEAKRIEDALEDGDIDDLRIEHEIPVGNRHDSFVINSIISSVAYLESVINEFYKRKLELAENDFSNQRIASNSDWATKDFYRLLEQTNTVENSSFEYKSSLKKYQMLLVYSGNQVFDSGKEPYQKVKNVCKLRNHFVHHEPEWVKPGGEEESPHRLIASLQGKFEKNPLVGEDALQFPDQYLSSGCARWCFKSVSGFIDEFFERVGASPPHYHKKDVEFY